MTSSHNRLRNYLTGLSTGSARMIIHVLVGLWLTPYTLRFLDREEFGLFTLTLDVLGWLTLMDLGITAGIRIQAARLSGQPEPEKINRLVSTAFFAQNAIVLAVVGAGLALAWGFPQFFPIRPDLQRDAMLVMALSVIGVAASIWGQVFSALLIANQQMHVDNLFGLLLIAIRTVLTVVFLKMGWGIYSLAAAHLVGRLVTVALACVRTFRLLPALRIRYRYASWDELRQIGGLGVWFSLGAVAGMVINSLDTAMTAKIVSVETVATLALTSRVYELAGGLVWLVSENARPMLGQMLGLNQKEESLKAYRQLFVLSSGLAVVAALAVWSGNQSFVTAWVGPANYGGANLDLALALATVCSLWVMPNRVILSANLAVRGQCLVRILEGILNVGLSIYLGMRFGVVGVMAATGIAALLTSMWMLPLLTAKMFHRPFWRFVWEDARPVLVVLALLFPVAVLSRGVSATISGFLGAAAAATLTGVCGVVMMWFLLLDKKLRERLAVRQFCERSAGAARKTVAGKFRALAGSSS